MNGQETTPRSGNLLRAYDDPRGESRAHDEHTPTRRPVSIERMGEIFRAIHFRPADGDAVVTVEDVAGLNLVPESFPDFLFANAGKWIVEEAV